MCTVAAPAFQVCVSPRQPWIHIVVARASFGLASGRDLAFLDFCVAYQDGFLKITCVAQKNCLPAREKFSEFHPPSI